MEAKLANLPSNWTGTYIYIYIYIYIYVYTVQIEPLSQNSHPTLIVIRQRIHIEETFVLMIIMTPMNIGVTNKGKRNFSIKLEFSITIETNKT